MPGQPAGVHGSDVLVADGVKVGEQIAVKGAGFLKDGDVVQVAGSADETAMARQAGS